MLALNSLPNDKIIDWTKFKGFADDKIYIAEKFKFAYIRKGNIVRKGENAGYQHVLDFPRCFLNASFLEVVKTRGSVI